MTAWILTIVPCDDEIEQYIFETYEEAEEKFFAFLGRFVHNFVLIDKNPKELAECLTNTRYEFDGVTRHITYACVWDTDIYIKEYKVKKGAYIGG